MLRVHIAAAADNGRPVGDPLVHYVGICGRRQFVTPFVNYFVGPVIRIVSVSERVGVGAYIDINPSFAELGTQLA